MMPSETSTARGVGAAISFSPNHFPRVVPTIVPTTAPTATTSTTSAEEIAFTSFWKDHWTLLENNLSNLSIVPQHQFEVLATTNSRMVTRIATSDEYRLIRFTYLESTDPICPMKTAYTCVLYPRSSEIPVLGMDLLQFKNDDNSSRSLAVCDFQPVHEEQKPLANAVMASLQQSYNLLNKKRSANRFGGQDSPFFSAHTLLGRSQTATEETKLWQQTMSATQRALRMHMALAKSATADTKRRTVDHTVLQHHRAYDKFCAQGDTRTGLPILAKLFGADVADAFVHCVKFPLSRH